MGMKWEAQQKRGRDDDSPRGAGSDCSPKLSAGHGA